MCESQKIAGFRASLLYSIRLAAQLGAFDEKDRLETEIERLKKLRMWKAAPITRGAGEPEKAVAEFVKTLLVD
ncbi:hypothetical protein [Paraburkholderia phenoliruptrix]|uniref:hypothetical protein n=1 Tax=Paraburkholderia phenoliruptrix TaxID=252970 RepID=UPI002869BD74|nr:hypothetical protein [Paraburkholderia phenoliruptrix]WMY09566.1 hypothetical protein P3F88_07315 [Paraburkholderia phenoliruptrix]